jgi:hypothetical protein
MAFLARRKPGTPRRGTTGDLSNGEEAPPVSLGTLVYEVPTAVAFTSLGPLQDELISARLLERNKMPFNLSMVCMELSEQPAVSMTLSKDLARPLHHHETFV